MRQHPPTVRRKAALRAWRKDQADQRVLAAIPWLAPGWLDYAEAWVVDCLRGQGIRAESGLLPVKTIFAGATFRMQTSAGLVYFKCHSPVYVREVAQTALVAGWAPEQVPAVLGADPERNFLLTREVPGPTLASVGAPGPWFAAVRAYADLQLASPGRLQQPQAECLSDWRVSHIRDPMAVLIDRLPGLQTGFADPLKHDELARLQALVPTLARRCDEVAAYGLPDTLEHGDLHAQNIILTGPDQSPVFLDWALAGVTHPFMGLLMLLQSVRQSEPLQGEMAELAPGSYLTWAIRRRQFYLVKSFRKLLR